MNDNEAVGILLTELQLLEAAVEEADEKLAQRIGVLMVDEMKPIYVYVSSLSGRIRQMQRMPEKEARVDHWRELYKDTPEYYP